MNPTTESHAHCPPVSRCKLILWFLLLTCYQTTSSTRWTRNTLFTTTRMKQREICKEVSEVVFARCLFCSHLAYKNGWYRCRRVIHWHFLKCHDRSTTLRFWVWFWSQFWTFWTFKFLFHFIHHSFTSGPWWSGGQQNILKALKALPTSGTTVGTT